MNTEPAVVCHNIHKIYGAQTNPVIALRGVDLTVNAGELLMLVGPSGSGKTTLISIIAGILSQEEGECLLFGENLNQMSERERTAFRGHHIGFVFQAFNLIPMLTSAENVAVPLILNGVEREEAIARASELLTSFGLSDKLNTSPLELSGGQMQRVAIARGCIHHPRLIVCDEPTSALDHQTGEMVLTLLKEQALKENRSLIVVTHDARIFHYADRIAKMEDGAIVSIEASSK